MENHEIIMPIERNGDGSYIITPPEARNVLKDFAMPAMMQRASDEVDKAIGLGIGESVVDLYTAGDAKDPSVVVSIGSPKTSTPLIIAS